MRLKHVIGRINRGLTVLRSQGICLFLSMAGLPAPGFEKWEDREMKLHDAMRKAVREYGVRVISEKQLLFILSDLRAFDELPEVKQVLEAIVSGGAGNELVRLFLDEDRDWFLSYAENLKKSLSGKSHFREDLADYAVGAILFGLGAQDSVSEPLERGSCSGHRETGAQTVMIEAEDKVFKNERSGGVLGAGAAADTEHGHSAQGVRNVQAGSSEVTCRGGAAPLKTGSKSSSKGLRWGIAAVILAGIACGWMFSSLTHRHDSAAVQTVSGTAVQESKQTEQGGISGNNAGARKSGDGSTGNLPGQYAHENGKAYYVDSFDWYPEDLKELRESAEQGNALAQNNLGVMFAEGICVSEDYAEAVKWIRKSAEQGNSAGEANLGKMYIGARGLMGDLAEGEKWLRKSAEQGNAFAELSLGELYRNGKSAAAELSLGGLYQEGQSVARDGAEAEKWFLKSAEHGNAFAALSLGGLYRNGMSVAENEAESEKWIRKGLESLRKSAEQGNASTAIILGFMLQGVPGAVAKNEAESEKWIRKGLESLSKSAEQGNACAGLMLGDFYRESGKLAFIKENAKSLQLTWYRKSAEQGNAVAQYRLGSRYDMPSQCNFHRAPEWPYSCDYHEALKWYRAAADQGVKDARIGAGRVEILISAEAAGGGNGEERGGADVRDAGQLSGQNTESGKTGEHSGEYEYKQGMKYYFGLGVTKNYDEADKWFKKSADLGNARGEAWLGVMLVRWQHDDAMTLKWFENSAQHGDALGEALLGIMYMEGYIVGQDYSEAQEWFLKSAVHGNEANGIGEEWLGRMYETGRGASRDYAEALKWYRMASAHGNRHVQGDIERVEKLVSEAAGKAQLE